MKTLIVDNHTTLLKELCAMAPKPSKVTKFENLRNTNLDDVGLIILSGASNFPNVMGHENMLKNEIDLVLNSGKPIIGICYGCELIARAFGAKLEKRPSGNKKEVSIKIINEDKIFGGLESFTSYENHSWVVKKILKELEALAVSDHGIEIFRHKNRPIYGLQFHPEKVMGENIGRKVFEKIVGNLSI